MADRIANRKSHSYTVRETIPTGAAVVFTEDVVYYETIPAGTRGTVLNYSNAGFRGIEASVRLDNGLRVHGISAGSLAASDGPAMFGSVVCHSCGERHEATYSHEGQWGEGAIYEVVCTADNMSDFYTTEVVEAAR